MDRVEGFVKALIICGGWPRYHHPLPTELRVPPVPSLWGPGRVAPISRATRLEIGVSSWSMKGQRIRYRQTGDFHFLAFRCFHRRDYFAAAAAKGLFEDALERVRHPSQAPQSDAVQRLCSLKLQRLVAAHLHPARNYPCREVHS